MAHIKKKLLEKYKENRRLYIDKQEKMSYLPIGSPQKWKLKWLINIYNVDITRNQIQIKTSVRYHQVGKDFKNTLNVGKVVEIQGLLFVSRIRSTFLESYAVCIRRSNST